jgi:hypothetical protein
MRHAFLDIAGPGRGGNAVPPHRHYTSRNLRAGYPF